MTVGQGVVVDVVGLGGRVVTPVMTTGLLVLVLVLELVDVEVEVEVEVVRDGLGLWEGSVSHFQGNVWPLQGSISCLTCDSIVRWCWCSWNGVWTWMRSL